MSVGSALAAISKPPQTDPSQAAAFNEAKTAPDKLGTKDQPAMVDLSPSSVLKVEALDKTTRPVDHLSPEWVLAYITAALASITAALALYTFRLYRATVGLGRDEKQNAIEQTARMERSVVEASRAATAMEGVALATNNNAVLMQSLLSKQMRAHLSVDIGLAIYQDANLRFEARSILTNNGLTPARNVSFKILADIIDASAPVEHVFPDIGDVPNSDAGIAPRQSFSMAAVVDHRVPDADVPAIMQGSARRLFAWGKVKYNDVYGGRGRPIFAPITHFLRALMRR